MKEKAEFRKKMQKVLETSFPSMNEEKMNMMLDYATWHAEMESFGTLNEEVLDKTRCSTVLPESLKVMFNLNLQNKRVVLSTNASAVEYVLKVKMPAETSEYPFNIDDAILHKALESLIEKINSELEGKAGIKLNVLISEIQTLREANMCDLSIVIRSKYQIID